MTNKQKQLLKKLEKYSKFGDNFSLSIQSNELKEILKLINKPVTTTNEQPKTFTFEEIYAIETALKSRLRTRTYIQRVKETLLKS